MGNRRLRGIQVSPRIEINFRSALLKRLRELSDLLELTDLTQEDLHDLRVACRRLLAVRLLFRPVDSNLFSLLKEIMDRTNAIRDEHIHNSWLEKQALAPANTEEDHQSGLQKICRLFPPVKKRIDEIIADPVPEKHVATEQLPKLWTKGLAKTRCCLQQLEADNPSSFHHLRISIKQLRYRLEFLQDALAIELPDLDRLIEWQDKLGGLQDLQVILASEKKSARHNELLRDSNMLMNQLRADIDSLLVNLDCWADELESVINLKPT